MSELKENQHHQNLFADNILTNTKTVGGPLVLSSELISGDQRWPEIRILATRFKRNLHNIARDQLLIEQEMIASTTGVSKRSAIRLIADKPSELFDQLINGRKEGKFFVREEAVIAGGPIDQNRQSITRHLGQPIRRIKKNIISPANVYAA